MLKKKSVKEDSSNAEAVEDIDFTDEPDLDAMLGLKKLVKKTDVRPPLEQVCIV